MDEQIDRCLSMENAKDNTEWSVMRQCFGRFELSGVSRDEVRDELFTRRS